MTTQRQQPREEQRAALVAGIRDSLSPEAVAATIAFPQSADFYKPANEAAECALREVAWLREALVEMLGADELNRLVEELGL